MIEELAHFLAQNYSDPLQRSRFGDFLPLWANSFDPCSTPLPGQELGALHSSHDL